MSPADIKEHCGFCGRGVTLSYDVLKKRMRCVCACGATIGRDVYTPADFLGTAVSDTAVRTTPLQGEPMDFFARVAIAIAMVEDHMANQGYYETRLEQRTLRAANDVFKRAVKRHKHLLPSRDLTGWPMTW